MRSETVDCAPRRISEEAAYEVRLRACVRNGLDDFEHGRYVEGINAFERALDERLASRAGRRP